MSSENIKHIYFYTKPFGEPARVEVVEVQRATPRLVFVKYCEASGYRMQIPRTSANYSAKQCIERKIAWMKSNVYQRTEALQRAEAELVFARGLLEATE